MNQFSRFTPTRGGDISPLVLSDRLLTLAQEAYEAGYQAAARRLVSLAFSVLDAKLRERASEAAVA